MFVQPGIVSVVDEAQRSTRTRPAKAALSRDAVIEAALWVLKREGIEGLSMRRIAQRLDTGAASLYVYVANRDELYSLVFERIASEIELPAANPKKWREQIKQIANEMLRVLGEYPGSSRMTMAHVPTGPNAMRLAEAILGLLRAGGVSDAAAAYAMDLLSLYITSIAYEESIRSGGGGAKNSAEGYPEHKAELDAAFGSLDAQRYPNITELAPAMTVGDGPQRFEWGLDIIINGLLATPQPGASN